MTEVDTNSFRPLLTSEPDARRGATRLFDPFVFPYVALTLGVLATSLLALYNAVLLRRGRQIAAALAAALLGWPAFILVAFAFGNTTGLQPAAIFLVTRLIHVVFGFLLYRTQRGSLRGHTFLDGLVIPLLPAYLGALILSLALPRPFVLLLFGVPLGF